MPAIVKRQPIRLIRCLSWPIRFVYCIYALLAFVFFMLLVFPLVIVATFWGKIRGGNFIYKLCRFWTDGWMFAIGIRHRNVNAAGVHPNKQYVFIANHISYLDIPVILKSIRNNKIRVLGKHEMKRLPIFGFIYRSAVVMVDRSTSVGRSKSVRILKSVLSKGISVFIYPEGTFNETTQPLKEFFDGAFRIAIETQTPIMPMLFLDTFDRLNYKSIFSLTPGISRTIFLDEIPVAGLTYSDLPQLKEKAFRHMEEVLRTYHSPWIRNKHQRDMHSIPS